MCHRFVSKALFSLSTFGLLGVLEALPMAQNRDCASDSPNFLCQENTNTCFDALAWNDDPVGNFLPWLYHVKNKKSFLNIHGSKSLMGFQVQSEKIIKEMIGWETQFLPRDDYLQRLRSGDLNLSARGEALDWIWKAQAHYNFEPLCFSLSVNYLDRFLSVYELPRGKAWTAQLLAVTCLSLAAKMEEMKVPLLIDLQVGNPKFVFEAKTVQRMELLVLGTLKWRMLALTPYSFIDYFLSKVDSQQIPSTSAISRSIQLISITTRGMDFLEFRPSEIAAAVAISVTREVQAIGIDQTMARLMHVVQGSRVLKCIDLIKDLSRNSAGNVVMPHSPNGVLDAAACLSYKSDDVTCANSSLTRRH